MMRRASGLLCAAILAGLTPAGSVRAQFYGKAPIPGDLGPDAPKNADFVQKLGASLPLDLTFTDHDGRTAPLRETVGGKPTVLILHYNRCPKLCNEVIVKLLETLNELRRTDKDFVAGQSFNVVFVSIDPRESPAVVRKNRELFLREYDNRNPDAPGVWFLTASHGQGTDLADAERKVHQLADAVGFQYELRFRNRDYVYRPDDGKWASADGRYELPSEARSYDYGHAAGITFVTPEGTVSKYLMGLQYPPRDVRLALVDASGGKIGTLSDAVRSFCFTYDEVKGHYKVAMRFVAAAFTPVMLLVMYLAFRAWRTARNEPALLPGQALPGQPPVDTSRAAV